MPARSPWPADPPKSPELAEALLVEADAVAPAGTPPEPEAQQWEDVVLPSSLSLVDYHEDPQFAKV